MQAAYGVPVDAIRIEGEIHFWSPERQGGLAVVDVPAEHHAALGGLRQQQARGSINGAAFASSLMPAGGGRLALSVSKAMQKDAGVSIGDDVDVEITGVGRD